MGGHGAVSARSVRAHVGSCMSGSCMVPRVLCPPTGSSPRYVRCKCAQASLTSVSGLHGTILVPARAEPPAYADADSDGGTVLSPMPSLSPIPSPNPLSMDDHADLRPSPMPRRPLICW